MSSLVVISVSAGISFVHTHTDTHNISQTHATNLFLVDLFLSNSKAKPPYNLHNRFSKLACDIWFLYHPVIIFFLIFDFEGGKPSSVSVMNHCFLKPIRFSLNLHSWNWRESHIYKCILTSFTSEEMNMWLLSRSTKPICITLFEKMINWKKTFLAIPWALQRCSANSFNHKTFVVFKEMKMAE